MIWKILKFFLFRFDPEQVHRTIVHLTQKIYSLPGGKTLIEMGSQTSAPSFSRQIAGLEFALPLGLAAGFDKDGELLPVLPSLGFGFAEIGTVTPRPQEGNPKPRLFRDAKRLALFNCMGFNGAGAVAVSRKVSEARAELPSWFRVGINVGKNKDTPLEKAHLDYKMAASAFRGLADYITINVSSPNTPGLRSLQTLEALKPIIESVKEEIEGWSTRPAIFLKLAPEVQGSQLDQILSQGEVWGIQGWVLTNTLGGSWTMSSEKSISGGWSGLPLRDLARDSLREARLKTRLPIISVGGILSSEDAKERLEMGADLIQIYTGWVMNGPTFPSDIARALLKSK